MASEAKNHFLSGSLVYFLPVWLLGPWCCFSLALLLVLVSYGEVKNVLSGSTSCPHGSGNSPWSSLPQTVFRSRGQAPRNTDARLLKQPKLSPVSFHFFKAADGPCPFWAELNIPVCFLSLFCFCFVFNFQIHLKFIFVYTVRQVLIAFFQRLDSSPHHICGRSRASSVGSGGCRGIVLGSVFRAICFIHATFCEFSQ